MGSERKMGSLREPQWMHRDAEEQGHPLDILSE